MRAFTVAFLLLFFGIDIAEAHYKYPGGDLSNLPPDTRCNLSFGGGVIDYGSHSRAQLQTPLSNSSDLSFGKRRVTLNVSCSHRQKMSFVLRGDKSKSNNLRFGDQGSLVVRFFDAQMDGQSVQLIKSTTNVSLTHGTANSVFLMPGEGFSALAGGSFAEGRIFTVHVEVEPVLPESETRVSAIKTSKGVISLELLN